jgi:hypothetical protein
MQTRAGPSRAPTRSLRWLPVGRLGPGRREALVTFLLCLLAAALVALPVAVERAIETVSFPDNLGTFPVEVGLCHDGRSTLDTGILGKVYWDRTGAFGFGAYARATGPPEAGGTLASYVDPAFFQANVALIHNPDSVVAAYSSEIRSALLARVARDELVAAVLGGAGLFLLVPRRRLQEIPRRRVVLAGLAVVGTTLVLSTLAAVRLFDDWGCSAPTGEVYAAKGMQNPTFSSPQMSEIVAQVQPFIDKNTRRIDAAGEHYETTAAASFAAALQPRAGALAPRDGETVVLGEADTQGSFVGVHVRKKLYADLVSAFGKDAVALRTIAGDVTSNGTVAESAYVKAEAKVTPDVPVVAVGGDHDSEKTWKQMRSAGITVPDLTTVEVGGLHVSGANDREHKTLFGGRITNTSGISEEELGRRLRHEVGDQTSIVVVHQPSALVGYLGLGSLTTLRDRPQTQENRTTPYDDGIPDLPPGLVEYGHLHQAEGPWVVWNTDSGAVTWTVVDQLGTAGGVENAPTFSRFSTPFSPPLKPIMVRLQYFDTDTGLQTGYATVECGVDASCTVSDRVDVGLPGGEPGRAAGAATVSTGGTTPADPGSPPGR